MNYAAYVDRSHRAFKAFELLRKQKLYEDAFSRGFYAILHMSFALLIKEGQTLPKTYNGLVSTLWSLREKLGLSDSVIQTFSRMQALREGGDYEPVPLIQESDLGALMQLYRELESKVGKP